VIALDAACLVALLRGEAGAPVVADLLRAGGGVLLSAANRAEVVDRLARQGAPSDAVIADLDLLELDAVDVTNAIADRAGQLRARYYHRTDCPLSLADCIALATAAAAGARLATSDAALARTARDAGVTVVAVPNSHGKAPTADV
jgi:uncharacterized protein with PIN domain